MTTQRHRRRSMKLAADVDAALHCSDSRGMAADLIQNALTAAEQRGREDAYGDVRATVMAGTTGDDLLKYLRREEIRSRQDKPAT